MLLPCKRIKAYCNYLLTTYYIILTYVFLLTVENRQHLLGLQIRSLLQLRSDIQIYATCIRLSPSLIRFAVPVYSTVFVIVFSYNYFIIRRNP